MQTKFILTKDVQNKDISELINSLNNNCSRNIYDVTDSVKMVINSNADLEIFNPVPLANKDLGPLITKLQDNTEDIPDTSTLNYSANTNQLLQKLELTLKEPAPLDQLKKLLNNNYEILILQSQNNAIFNTLGLLKLYSRSNIPDIEAVLYSTENANLFSKGLSKATVYQNAQGHFTHVQMMQVGYWMAQQEPDVINKLILMFMKGDL